MRRILISLVLILAFSSTFASCRDTKKADDIEDVTEDLEEALEDAEEEIEEVVDDEATNTN